MNKAIARLMFFAVLMASGAVGLLVYQQHHSIEQQKIDELRAQNAALQEKQQQLQLAIDRLHLERRLARFVVTEQKIVNAKLQTTILLNEYRRDGSVLPSRQFVIDGNEIHFDAEIVKFNDQYVESGDPLRGQSILLLQRLYGANQAPSQGFAIDEPGTIPDIYSGQDARAKQFEKPIWDDFWRLFNDQAARQARGIRGLHGEGLWGIFEPNHVYTLDIRPDGASIHEEPMDPLYQSALQARAGI